MEDNINKSLFCDAVKSKVPILEIAMDRVKDLEKRGGKWDYVGLSIFNDENTPSFKICSKKQIFHCFSSGKSGDVLDLYAQTSNPKLTRYEAALELNTVKNLNIIVPEIKKVGSKQKYTVIEKSLIDELNHVNLYTSYNSSIKNKAFNDYISKRQIEKDTLVNFYIGFIPSFEELQNFMERKKYSISEDLLNQLKSMEGRLIIPIYDIDGNVIDFSARSIDQNDSIKYRRLKTDERLNQLNINRKLYNLDKASKYIKSLNQIVLVEGYFDVFRLYQCGIKNVIAIQTAHLGDNIIKKIMNLDVNIVIFLDSDEAGVDGAKQIAGRMIRNSKFNKKVSIVNWNSVKHDEKDDPDTFGIRKKNELVDLIRNAENYEKEYIQTQLNRLKNDNTYTLFKFMEDTGSKVYYHNDLLELTKNLIKEVRIDLRNQINILYEDNLKLQSIYFMDKFKLEDIYARKILNESMEFVKDAREMRNAESYLYNRLNDIYDKESIEVNGHVFDSDIYSKAYYFGIQRIDICDEIYAGTYIVRCTFDYIHKKIFLMRRIRKRINTEKNNHRNFFNSESIIPFGPDCIKELEEFCSKLENEKEGVVINGRDEAKG